jgi:cholesterol transport system auxiliary component
MPRIPFEQDPAVTMKPARRAARIATVAAAAALMGGCAYLFPDPPPPTYDLRAVGTGETGRTAAGRGTLIIAAPQAIQTVDSQRLVARQGTSQISYIPDAQWSDSLPNLLQARLLQSFENAGRLARVGRPEDRLSPDYQLLTDIRAFEIEAGPGQPQAVIELSVKIVSDQGGRVVAGRVFQARRPATGVTGEAAALALNDALGAVLSEIVGWAGGRI